MSPERILLRATNWVGDAVISLPALRAVRERYPAAHIAVLARPWVADLYARESAFNRVIRYAGDRLRTARELRRERFDCAILFPNSLDAALPPLLAGIPTRIGYRRNGRGWLLTADIPVPKPGDIPRHQRYYYLELLRRAGILDRIPETDSIRLEGAEAAARLGAGRFRQAGLDGAVTGISPGAANSRAKCWPPERFAETALRLGNPAAIFGTAGERSLCEAVAEIIRGRGGAVHNFAGETTLGEFIELAAACRLFLTNDSGAMHVAAALGVVTLAVFGPTDDTATGPAGLLARIIREPVECSPCLYRDCPIDHRCMRRVTVDRVAEAAEDLLSGRPGAAW